MERLERIGGTVDHFSMPEYVFEILRWLIVLGVVCVAFGVVDGLNAIRIRRMEGKLWRK